MLDLFALHTMSVFSHPLVTPHFLMFGREAHLPIDLQFGTTFGSMSPIHYAQQLHVQLGSAFELVRHTLGEVQERQT